MAQHRIRLQALKVSLGRTSAPSAARRNMSLMLGATTLTALGALALTRKSREYPLSNEERAPENLHGSEEAPMSPIGNAPKMFPGQEHSQTKIEIAPHIIRVMSPNGEHVRDVSIEELGHLSCNCGVDYVLLGDTQVYRGIELQRHLLNQNPGEYSVTQIRSPAFRVVHIHFWARGKNDSIEEFQGVICSPLSMEELQDNYYYDAATERFKKNNKLHSNGLEHTVSWDPKLGFERLTLHISQVLTKTLRDHFPVPILNRGTPAQDVPFVQMNLLTIRSNRFHNKGYIILQGSCYRQQFFYTCGQEVFERSQKNRRTNETVMFGCQTRDGVFHNFFMLEENSYTPLQRKLLDQFCSDILWKDDVSFNVSYETLAKEVYPAANHSRTELEQQPKNIVVDVDRAAICTRGASVDESQVPIGFRINQILQVSKHTSPLLYEHVDLDRKLWSFFIQKLGGFEECLSFGQFSQLQEAV